MLKRTFLSAVALAAFVAFVAPASAATTFYEGFSYTVGTSNLTGQGGWGAHPNTANSFDVVSGTMGYTDASLDVLVTSGDSAKGNVPVISGGIKALGGATSALFGTTQTVYYSVLVDGHGSVVLSDGASSKVNITLGANSASYSPGLIVRDTAGNDAGAIYTATNVPYGTSTFIGLKIDNVAGGNDTVTMALNPDLSSPNWTLGPNTIQYTGFDFGVLSNVDVYSRGEADGIPPQAGSSLRVDEIRIGLAWADVAPIIPEPASLGLLAIGGLMIVRRRRA